MVKSTFFVLLLLNGGLFAWHQGYLRDLLPSEREPGRMASQLQPERMRLLSATQVQSMQNVLAPNDGPSAASASTSASTPATATSAPTPAPTAAVEQIACLEIGSFALADARRFETQLAALKLGERQARINLQESGKFMVYIPAMPSREKVDEKLKQLEARGIKKNEYFVFPENSPLKWTISLGTFSNEDAAKKHLDKLMDKNDVRTAKVGPAPGVGPTSRVAFQLRNIDSEIRGKVEKIKQGFAAQELRACSKPLAG